MRIRDAGPKDIPTGLGGERSGRFHLGNVEMATGDGNKGWHLEMRQGSRVHAGCTDGLGAAWIPGPSGEYPCAPLPAGASMWQPSWTSEDCGTRLPVRRFWRWPGTWNSLKVVPYHPLGTTPSLRTSPCPAHPSASASLSSWGASPSPGWPGPAWLVCPCGHGLRRQFEPEPSAEAAGAHAAADPPSSLPRDPWPETRASGTGGALASPPSPECPP